MDASVSCADPGEFHRGHQNGYAAGLVIDDLSPFEIPCNPDEVDLLVAAGPELTSDVVCEQARMLEAEFCAEFDRLDITADDDGSYCDLAQEEDGRDDEAGVLPGFESLTRADLNRARLGQGNQVPDSQKHCPDWCSYASLPVHGDGFDATPEPNIPHRGVPHDIPVLHGGQSLDHAGRAEISLQLEQDRDPDSAPVITLSVVIRGIEHTAWLTPAEARTLQRTLGQLHGDATGNG